MWQLNGWEVYYSNYFSVFWRSKKNNPLDYFRMGNIEEVSFFFFDVEDPVRNQNFVQK